MELRLLVYPDVLTFRPVSQFTLLASTKKGNKPDFHGALGGEEAKRLYEVFFAKVQAGYQADRVKDGVFQAMMEVALVNDGPVSCLCPCRQSLAPVPYRVIFTVLKVTLELTAVPKEAPKKPLQASSEASGSTSRA